MRCYERKFLKYIYAHRGPQKTRRNILLFSLARSLLVRPFLPLLLLLLHNIYDVHRSIQFGQHSERNVSPTQWQTDIGVRIARKTDTVPRVFIYLFRAAQPKRVPIVENGPINSYLLLPAALSLFSFFPLWRRPKNVSVLALVANTSHTRPC